jgi:hypothetical protein
MILKSIFFIGYLFQMASPFTPFETLVFLLVVILCNFLPYFLFYKALFRLCKGKSAKDHLSLLYSGFCVLYVFTLLIRRLHLSHRQDYLFYQQDQV